MPISLYIKNSMNYDVLKSTRWSRFLLNDYWKFIKYKHYLFNIPSCANCSYLRSCKKRRRKIEEKRRER